MGQCKLQGTNSRGSCGNLGDLSCMAPSTYEHEQPVGLPDAMVSHDISQL